MVGADVLYQTAQELPLIATLVRRVQRDGGIGIVVTTIRFPGMYDRFIRLLGEAMEIVSEEVLPVEV